MGAVAGRLSDVIFITSDNPRSENPSRIIEEIQRGITPDTRRGTGQRILPVVDRKQAIDEAIETALAGDLVLIAGKGHEKYQVIGTESLAVRRRRGRTGSAGASPQQAGRQVTVLLHLLYPFHTAIRRAERDPLHHVPDGGGESLGACDQPAVRTLDGPLAARVPDRPGNPTGRAAEPSREGRDADDGRPADSDRALFCRRYCGPI